MNRRGFLRKLFAGVAAVATGGVVASVIKRTPTIHTLNQREAVIAAALDTPEGKHALAQAMCEPIKRSLNYQDLGRKLLMVDELPQGALARYEKDVASVAMVLNERSKKTPQKSRRQIRKLQTQNA